MDCEKIGRLIAALRKEQGLTQRELAERLCLSDRTVSKWERGLGAPDISLLPALSRTLGIRMEDMLAGELSENDLTGGNMKQNSYRVCPVCGNLILTTAPATVSCCGRTLEPLEAQKPDEAHMLSVETVENDWYITSAHPMTKAHSLSFVAFVTADRMQLVRLYPEWDLQVRIPRRGHGLLLWYCTEHGLFRQIL